MTKTDIPALEILFELVVSFIKVESQYLSCARLWIDMEYLVFVVETPDTIY